MSATVNPGLKRAIVVTAALWGPGAILYLALSMALGTLTNIQGGLLQVFTCLVAAGLGLALYGVLEATAGWTRARRAAAIGLALIGAVVVQTVTDLGLLATIGVMLEPRLKDFATFEPSRFPTPMFIYFWLFSLNLTLLLLASAADRVRLQERALGEAKMAAQQAQIAALRLQLNPHFLFNTLNAISSLVIEGRNRDADTMISRLSDFLRASLSMEPAEQLRLEDELDTIQAYLEIERARFGDRLAVDFAVAPGLSDALVPGLLLQPLVENAIKYGVATSKTPVTIRIEATQEADDLVLMVEDDAPVPSQAAPGGAGVGLSNIRRRLDALYGTRGLLSTVQREAGYLALVRLPLQRAVRPGRQAAA